MTSSSDFNIKNLEKSKSVNYNSTSKCDNRRQLEKSTSFFSPDSSIRSGKKKNLLDKLDKISLELSLFLEVKDKSNLLTVKYNDK